ncbi:hypothetical protein [Nodosilinea nodulosa]|uniref:hypothetical protein n=1 Tax=Nodosilinea nodulosa TaxID=416001 RepID=UPI000474EF2A|nr:hypothetical protein [Nodosilinea nodulosa]
MKLHPTLLAASSLLALLSPTAAQADDGILSFELTQPQWATAAPVAPVAPVAPATDSADQPLPIPPQAANPPMRYHSPQQLPAGVYRRGVAVALNTSTSATALLPPAPPPAASPVLVAIAPPEPTPQEEPKQESKSLALDFGVEPSPAVVALAQAKLLASRPPANPLTSLFEGNSDSLVAWAVGSAEGTRTPNGAINPAYFGHTDPGNRVWNLGTFSYQHGAKTPEEADQKQLARLKSQGDVLRQRALKQGLNLTLEETLNGLDLANQSPLAAIGRVGYIERLAEAKAIGLEGSEAILVARTRSYINPNTGRWNAPGLGNTEASIRRDQKRRASAVASAIAAYESQNPQLQAQTWTLNPSPPTAPDALVAQAGAQPEPVDDFLKMWTSPSDGVARANTADPEILANQPQADVSTAEPKPGSEAKDDGLAGLWQITVDRLSQISSAEDSADAPHTASLVGALFNPGPARDTAPGAPNATADATAPAPAEPSDIRASQAAAAEGMTPPTWEAAREANQTTSAQTPEPDPTVTVSTPPPGAVPTAAVYAPTPLAAAPAAPDNLPLAVAPAPASEAPNPAPDRVAASGTAATSDSVGAEEAQPAEALSPAEGSGSLVFDSAAVADLTSEPPIAELPAESLTPGLSEPALSEAESIAPESTAAASTISEPVPPQPTASTTTSAPAFDANANSPTQQGLLPQLP